MIKYTPSNQLSLSGFSHPFDQELSPNNRWVKLAQVIPWDALASVYLKQLSSSSGRESIDVRMVIGAIIVKHKLEVSDRETRAMISENIYLQYFCGLTAFQAKEPFHPTVFVDIRKRMDANSFDAWNALIIEKAEYLKPKKTRTVLRIIKMVVLIKQTKAL
jgi:IS5 family transposase